MFLVAQTTVKGLENKNKKQKSTEIKNNRKIKALGNITPTMDLFPKNGWMGDTDLLSGMSC